MIARPSSASLVLVALLLMPAISAAQVRQQDPLLDTLAALVDAGDSAAIHDFLTEHLAPEVLEKGALAASETLLRALHDQGGGVQLERVVAQGRGAFVTLTARRAPASALLWVGRTAGAPTRISGIEALTSVHAASEVHLALDSTDPSLAAQVIRAEVERLAAAEEFSGVVQVDWHGRTIYRGAVGPADPAAQRANTPETRFHVASIGKMFTAVAVAQLMAAGRFTPDTRASDLLPELPWSPAARAVTVRQLLEHTSGLGQAEHAGGDALAAVAAETPRFPPGTQWSYSNDGYELLAAIIAHVSGVSFERYLSRRVYRPAGMGGVSHDHARLPARVVAVGQRRRDDDYFGLMPRSSAAALVEGQRGTGAGGEYATTDDLIRFAEAFTSGRLLPAAWRDSLTAGRWPLPGPFPDERYGWGFASYMMRGHRIVGHAGGGMGWGICGRLDVEASSAFAVAVLSNYDPPVCERLGRGIAEMLAGL